jgi:hypothetical protein
VDGNGLSAAGHLPCHAGRTHTSLTRHTKNKLGEFLFPSAGRMLQFFPPLKCADFMKCVKEFRINLYVANTEVVPVKEAMNLIIHNKSETEVTKTLLISGVQD